MALQTLLLLGLPIVGVALSLQNSRQERLSLT
ncbi:unnamed protein product [Linum tenue]|uniref:Uncharacterized protein n=1 Tax=Linum tenue TaxID=586396 RepID=A0AAV0NCM4_9ROSI|nr:unnamed protein product [Linum tenue]